MFTSDATQCLSPRSELLQYNGIEDNSQSEAEHLIPCDQDART